MPTVKPTLLVYLIENIDLYNTCVGVVYIQLHANCQAYPTCLSTQGPIRFIILLQGRYQQRNYRPQYPWRPSYRNNMMGKRSGYQQYQQNYDTERRHYSPPTSTQQHNPRIQRDWQQYQQNQIPVGQQNNGDGTQT